MRIKIVSDGTILGTKILDSEIGKHVLGVARIALDFDVDNAHFCSCVLYMRAVPLEYEGEASTGLRG